MRYLKIITLFLFFNFVFAQNIYRYGSTAVNFLEIGVGSANAAMGDAGVAFADGPASVYWNPAALAFVERNENAFMLQPWILDINMMFIGSTIHVKRLGTFGFSLTHMGYGDMEVTTMAQQEGTGERFSANEFSAAFTYSRKIVQWFSFGASAKIVNSKIWHSSANAFALDLGAIVNTEFLSPNGSKEDGLRIGMSISNYGSRLQYDGIDLLNPIDISPYEDGNYSDVPGQFRPNQWELPLIFRIGIGLKPIYSESHRLKIAIDAIHPNNNAEYINLGGQYELRMAGKGSLYIRSGYKSLYMPDSQFGMTYGGGLKMNLIGNQTIQIDYAHRSMGIFGGLNSYTISIGF
jgi:hypothetical protein|tara:strand:- start:4041 stop:5087 length:1047 start_codon:yes stop_codon:yes gene_type:complete